MYLPRKSKLLFKFFSWYIDHIINKDFDAYTFNGIPVKENEAVLLLSNHFSWWDGFLMFQLNRLSFKKKFHVLVTSDDYEKNWYLKYVGAFAAVNRGKDVIETLTYAGALLDDANNLVLVFPQGKRYTSYSSGIAFEKGVMQIINASRKKFQIIFSATLVDYSGKRKPLVRTSLRSWEAEEYVSLQLLKSEYNKHYEQTVKEQAALI